MDYIYKLMTQPQLEAGPPVPGRETKAPYQVLPHARRGAVAGLLELLNDRGGKEDLYRIADELHLEVDDLLPIVEAAALLAFALAEAAPVKAEGSEADAWAECSEMPAANIVTTSRSR